MRINTSSALFAAIIVVACSSLSIAGSIQGEYTVLGPPDPVNNTVFNKTGTFNLGLQPFRYQASGVGLTPAGTAGWNVEMEATLGKYGDLKFRNTGSMTRDIGHGVGSELRLLFIDEVTLTFKGEELPFVPSFLDFGLHYTGFGTATYNGGGDTGFSRSRLDSYLFFNSNTPIFRDAVDNPFSVGPRQFQIDVTPGYQVPLFNSPSNGVFFFKFNLLTSVGGQTTGGSYDGNFLGTLKFDSIRLPDGRTPEEAGFEVTFASGIVSPNLRPEAVPEPSSLALLGMGLTGLGGYRWRRRKTTADSQA